MANVEQSQIQQLMVFTRNLHHKLPRLVGINSSTRLCCSGCNPNSCFANNRTCLEHVPALLTECNDLYHNHGETDILVKSWLQINMAVICTAQANRTPCSDISPNNLLHPNVQTIHSNYRIQNQHVLYCSPCVHCNTHRPIYFVLKKDVKTNNCLSFSHSLWPSCETLDFQLVREISCLKITTPPGDNKNTAGVGQICRICAVRLPSCVNLNPDMYILSNLRQL